MAPALSDLQPQSAPKATAAAQTAIGDGLVAKLRLLQTSSLRGDTIYTRCPSWVIASHRPLRISKRA